ncbi:hypothetical protein GQ53DRAFT_822682 [Thozetella sp. PMI_491]|nr:hypothetical protein GQ53DRAFT_822682 [Thozetella sp. PMI_491]
MSWWISPNENVDAEQMVSPGEGKVAEAVEWKREKQRNGYVYVHLNDYASSRKRGEQAGAREATKDVKRDFNTVQPDPITESRESS